ncbi:hypothetical protein [Novosphingobium sp. FSW06-99]|uniref:hypothetical protein n=1 Tax=Novosphingobium sp. FSW06-99 TaxID=1739113 RepID=UPI0012E3300B|nr:hypothetical protein [Novosphingobium sp. FSW06-99]
MTVWRRSLAAITFVTGGVWFASSFKLIAVPPRISRGFLLTYMVLWGVSSILDWRSRKEQPQKDPSPSQSAVGVIVATGIVAVVATAHDPAYASSYVVPAIILIATAFLAIAASRFASKNQGNIGEARFDTTSNGS